MNFNSLLELTDKSNNEFYPTPEPIVSKMLNDVDLYNFNTILEPSAGKGDILREIVRNMDGLRKETTEGATV